MLRRLRWLSDGGGAWELDAETPITMEGTARSVPGDPLPLGISRGPRVTRPKQLDFMHRFMASPLVPSLAANHRNGGDGVLLHHAHLFYLTNYWSATILEQINVNNFVSCIKDNASKSSEGSTWSRRIVKHIDDIFSFGFGTEFLITPDSSILLEAYNVKKGNRGKVIFQQKLAHHNLTMEAAWPGLFVDKSGTYWDVPLSLSLDLASVSTGSGLSYHICLQHNSGQPKHFGGNESLEVPVSLLPGLSAKAAISLKKDIDIWRKKDGKLKLVQPYDLLLSDPHFSASGILGAVVGASLGANSTRLVKPDSEKRKAFGFYVQSNNFGLFSDLFAAASCTLQHGNFQRLFLDLTRLNARLELPSGSSFLKGAACLARDLYKSKQPALETIQAICPDLTVTLQQQIGGPFSFRVDSKIVLNCKDGRPVPFLSESVYAIDWALKVLGSAKATAWYSPKHQEAMVELRFFES